MIILDNNPMPPEGILLTSEAFGLRSVFATETVVRMQNLALNLPVSPLDPLLAMQWLTSAASPREIGARGPTIAALAPPGNDALPELRLFEALFGRDSLRTASFLVESFPLLMRSTLLKLAALQGLRNDGVNEEQPGKILHEYRELNDPIRAELEQSGWRFPYYGAIDSTPLFIIEACRFVRERDPLLAAEPVTGRDGVTIDFKTAVLRSVEWLCRELDRNGAHVLEYQRTNPKGLINQAWKDSQDSYHHADGSPANHGAGIASIEVQALAYDALLEALQTFGADLDAPALRERAEKLRETVFGKFWISGKEPGYFALATDRDAAGELRPMQIRTSNMGHLLDSRLLDGDTQRVRDMKSALVANLMDPAMLAAAGIRTLASDELLFRPTAYHNGNVWPWDNYVIARGFRRHGMNELATQLEDKVLSFWKATNVFPEFGSGGFEPHPVIAACIVDVSSPARAENRIAQPPQLIQAWTVAAVLAILSRRTQPGIDLVAQ